MLNAYQKNKTSFEAYASTIYILISAFLEWKNFQSTQIRYHFAYTADEPLIVSYCTKLLHSPDHNFQTSVSHNGVDTDTIRPILIFDKATSLT